MNALPYAMQEVLDILKREPIRAIDGRYSDGFADCIQAQYLIHMGKAHIEIENGFAFFHVGPDAATDEHEAQ